MQEQVVARLKALRQEYETGQKMLAELEARRLELQQTLLRIGGAIQVLEELLAAEQPANANGGGPAAQASEPAQASPAAQAAPVGAPPLG
jgi:hypothetical protein